MLVSIANFHRLQTFTLTVTGCKREPRRASSHTKSVVDSGVAMRVALLAWDSLHSIPVGGVAAHVTELAAALQRNGHEVHVFDDPKNDAG